MKLKKKQQEFNELSDLFWGKGYTLLAVSSIELQQLQNLSMHGLPKNISYYIDLHLFECPENLKKYFWYDKLFLNGSIAKKFIKDALSNF